MSKIDVLLGLQWGDEGKGKVVDVLAPHYDIIARFQGGPNAGHTLVFNGNKYVLHCLPSGVMQPNTLNLIGNGMVVDPVLLQGEIDALRSDVSDVADRLLVSEKAHLILPTHKLLDAAYEQHRGKTAIGSTLKGIGPAYTDKIARQGLRVGDIFTNTFEEKLQAILNRHYKILDQHEYSYDVEPELKVWRQSIEQLKQLRVVDSAYFLDKQLRDNKRVLAEGAQGTLLDVEFGSYPYVTSSHTVAGGACSGLGVAPSAIGKVFGIFKAYTTRVGSGDFPTELTNEVGKMIQSKGNERGSTTGRERRCGWLDLVALRYACMLNGVTELYMMKSDVLSDIEEVKACVSYRINSQEVTQVPFDLTGTSIEPQYEVLPTWVGDITSARTWEDLPNKLKGYVQFIESYLDKPITMVSVGPDRVETVKR